MHHKTIRCYLLLTALPRTAISFIMPIYTIFLLGNGLNQFQAQMVNFMFFATLLVTELPTGILADVFGRKSMVLCACLLYTLGLVEYSTAHAFWRFVLAEITIGLGATCQNGASQSWLVDELSLGGYEGSVGTIFTREQQFGAIGSIGGMLAGSYLYTVVPTLPWLCAASIMLSTAVVACVAMHEQRHGAAHTNAQAAWRHLRSITTSGIAYGKKNEAVRLLLTLGGIQLLCIQALNMQWQPFYRPHLSSTSILGMLGSAITIALAIGSSLSNWALRRLGDDRRALLYSHLTIGIGMLGAAIFGWTALSLSAFMVHEIGRGLYQPLRSVYLNKHIPAAERATLISFESLPRHIGGMLGLVASGFIAQRFSITAAWTVSGIVMLASTCVLMRRR